MDRDVLRYEPDFDLEQWSSEEQLLLSPFATNLGGYVHILRNLPPEIVGALCSRASRASGSLLRVLLKEYLGPILADPNQELARELRETIAFLREHGFKNILNNQRAQAFYAKWLSQYGDDSIAQMTGAHLVFEGISQVAIKFVEDQRIGLEPIEKSTRYVSYGAKGKAGYLYYTPISDLERLGLLHEYRVALDHLFDVYVALLPLLLEWLKKNYDEKESILEKKAFDTLRGLLPMATVSQVAFRGNAQAFEYLVNRTARHHLGELRWVAQAAKAELDQEIPSLLLRLADEKSRNYQEYLARRRERVREFIAREKPEWRASYFTPGTKPAVNLSEYDGGAEDKIIAAILFKEEHAAWDAALAKARGLSPEEKICMFDAYLGNRDARWYKVGRAFENSYLRFEIVMNIGSYRDLHRHRMMTQDRQLFGTLHGYDLPTEVVESGLAPRFEEALQGADRLFRQIQAFDPELAQYVVPMAYRMRFYQLQNFRQFFWEAELRTISQGHPDYRHIEQEKCRLFKERFPLIAKFVLADMGDYPIARRGTEEKIARKEQEIIDKLGSRG